MFPDSADAQSWYLLGRCYMSQRKYNKAYEAYQQAVYRDGRNPTFWCSIGVLYYRINQYRDALDAYSRAIRLNPGISEVWYDLGTLVSCSRILMHISRLALYRPLLILVLVWGAALAVSPLSSWHHSTNHATIRPTMRLTLTNELPSSILTTATSKLVCSY